MKNYRVEKEMYKKQPWYATWRAICHRVKPKYHQSFMYYDIGIKNLLTRDELKELWFKYKACEMTKPTLHRIDNTKSYTKENCIYVEFSQHSKLHYVCHPRKKIKRG